MHAGRPSAPTRIILRLLLFAASGCTAIIGANEPTLRLEEDSSVPDSGTEPTREADASSGPADASRDRAANSVGATVGASEAASPSSGETDAQDDTAEDAPTDVAEGGCGNTTSDPRNCGACGHDCTALQHVSGPVTCVAGGQCAFPLSSCAAGWTHCGIDPDQGCETNLAKASDCGGCGNSCPSSAPICSGSGSTYSCVTGCSGTLPTLCGSTCVNTASDPGNCTTCTHACPGVTRGQPTCSNSACSIQCNSGYTACSGACVDETSDDNNCNGCGKKCAGGEHCVSGACQCTGGTHLCGATCVANDSSACGPSCTPCTAPTGGTVTCNGTSCVPSCNSGGDAICSNVCVNESTDVGHCGACTTACSGATPLCVSRSCVACTSGAQCTAGNTPQSCVNNQWVSQAACSGATPVCSNGACVACTSATRCAAGWVQTCSGNQWVNQTMCTSSQVCRTSACVNALHDVGWDTALSGSTSLSPNFLYLFRLPPLTHDATLLTFGAYGNGPGANAKLVLYGDNGAGTAPAGAPLAAVASPIVLYDGQREQDSDSFNVAMNAATTYWLGIVVDVATTIRSTPDAAAVGIGFSDSYNAAWPNGSAAPDYSGVDLAIYVHVQDTD